MCSLFPCCVYSQLRKEIPKGQNRYKSVLMPVNDDGYGEGEDEDAAESAQAADQLAGEGGRGELPVAGEQLVSCLTRLIITTQTK